MSSPLSFTTGRLPRRRRRADDSLPPWSWPGLIAPCGTGRASPPDCERRRRSPMLRRRNDHEIAGQRRMYARLLFVVVGIFEARLGFGRPDPAPWISGHRAFFFPGFRLGFLRPGGYTLRA